MADGPSQLPLPAFESHAFVPLSMAVWCISQGVNVSFLACADGSGQGSGSSATGSLGVCGVTSVRPIVVSVSVLTTGK